MNAQKQWDVVGNMIVGTLSSDGPDFPPLLANKFLDKVNYSTITRFINESHEKVRLVEPSTC